VFLTGVERYARAVTRRKPTQKGMFFALLFSGHVAQRRQTSDLLPMEPPGSVGIRDPDYWGLDFRGTRVDGH
jgi:hypothetical protein